MDAIPLSTPGGTVVTFMCGKCWRVEAPSFIQRPHGTVDDYARTRAFEQANACCACRECGNYVGETTAYTPLCAVCLPKAEAKRAEERVVWEAKQAQETAAYQASLQASLDPAIAQALESLMSDISESRWCAGWLVDLEYILWRDAHKRETPDMYNYAALLSLAEQCGGWCTHRKFIPMHQWRTMYADWLENNGHEEDKEDNS
jgi:hypothetical protein